MQVTFSCWTHVSDSLQVKPTCHQCHAGCAVYALGQTHVLIVAELIGAAWRVLADARLMHLLHSDLPWLADAGRQLEQATTAAPGLTRHCHRS